MVSKIRLSLGLTWEHNILILVPMEPDTVQSVKNNFIGPSIFAVVNKIQISEIGIKILELVLKHQNHHDLLLSLF